MASTQSGTPEAQPAGSMYRKRFVASAQDADHGSDGEGPTTPVVADEPVDGPLMSPKAAISGVGMLALAAVLFVVGSVLGGGSAGVSEETEQEAFDLNERITTANVQADALPAVEDVEDALAQVQIAADQVAGLQNDYRALTPAAAETGALDEEAVSSSLRTLVPLFSPNVDQSVLRPWYLLASDAEVPAGTGLPMGFDSGFQWVAQVPYGIEADSSITVTWLAVQTRTGEGEEPAVLAWAQATYDMKRGTFSEVTRGTTSTGHALALEVDGL